MLTDSIKLLNNKKSASLGFTLAEVLITLGIIGIVAAMTIPTLISKYQKIQYVTQLKKTYSTLQNGFKLMMAREGVSSLVDTEEWRSLTANYNTTLTENTLNIFKKNFNVVDTKKEKYNIKYLSGTSEDSTYNTYKKIFFSDGSLLYGGIYKSPVNEGNTSDIKAAGGHMYDYVGYFYIDINGTKKPNQFGRDVYKFYLSNDGNLFPMYGKDHAIFKSPDNIEAWYWKPNRCGIDSVIGDGCAARIIESGWVMDY